MITKVHFRNFKSLQDATLPLSRFTLLVGPNGSGKSTAMQGLQFVRNPEEFKLDQVLTAGSRDVSDPNVEVEVEWSIENVEWENTKIVSKSRIYNTGSITDREGPTYLNQVNTPPPQEIIRYLHRRLANFTVFTFNANNLAEPTHLKPNNTKIDSDGYNLAGALDALRDLEPERFEALNQELGRWLPEFDRILFDTPTPGQRALFLRTRNGRHRIKASDLSHGTLFALAFLTLAYSPDPPAIMCFEDPEKGMHPRLLREIRDGMYRLCYPEEYGDKREPSQVIATTHSPYLLDLYRDHPEEIVIAHKDKQGVHFERLSEKPNVEEFLQDAPLGEVWYSGVLGGVPVKP